MAYADLLDNEGIKSQYLAIMKPRRVIDSASWSLVSGTTYEQSFDFGEIIILTSDDSTLTLATSTALSDGDWYYDVDNENLLIDIGVNPNTKEIVGTYEIYLGTFDAHFNKDPLDSSTRSVYYEPLIVQSPQINSSATDALFGFLPSLSTQISISNATQFLQRHIYESSWNRIDISLYHWLDELITDNVKLVSKGFCSSIRSNDNQISIRIFDNNEIFDSEYRNVAGLSFYAVSAFPNLDPFYESRPIRHVYGVVDGFIPVNIDYVAESPTTSDNRDWICINPETNLGSLSVNPLVSPSSTATRTYLSNAEGFRVGDTVWIDSASGSGFDEFPIVTAVNKSGNHYIEHLSITNVATSSDVVKRSFVGRVDIFRQSVKYTARYGRDYDEYTDGTNKVAGFSFNTSMESNTGITGTLDASDLVFARVYGNLNTETLSASGFGSDSTETGNLAQAIVVIYSIMKNHLGLTEADDLDTATFSSLQGSVSDEVGFAVPHNDDQNFPSFRSLLTELFQTALLKLFYNDDLKYSLVQTGPKGAVDKTIEDDEILKGTFSYGFDYKDIRSDIFVEYARKQVSDRNEKVGEGSFSAVKSTSTLAKRLHKIEKQRTFKSLHYASSEAQTLADRLRYALGDRQGRIVFETKNRFFDSELNDNIKISRSRMPGFSFDRNTLRDREAVVLSSKKSLDKISIELDDQKGIEDNSGSW